MIVKRPFIVTTLMLSLLMLISCRDQALVTFRTSDLRIALDRQGRITHLTSLAEEINYVFPDSIGPLLSMRIDGEYLAPVSMNWNKDSGSIVLKYPTGIMAYLSVEAVDSHVRFSLDSVSEMESVELVTWGPYPTVLNSSIGETVGIVQGENFTLGIQALNPKTLGGYPWNENDCMPQIDILEQDNYNDLTEQGKREVLYRVEAAKPTTFGSTLQAYCRNRNRERIIENWGHTSYRATVFDDGGIIGSAIALFGCPNEKTLETIGMIEEQEGLPHPLIEGVWSKTSPYSSSAYIIMDFGVNNIEEAVEIARQAGLKYLYHPGPFESWGHFLLDSVGFPEGVKSMRECVEVAAQKGIHLGLHTLSNFITTNDPYVTPIPHQGLARVGLSQLSRDIGSSDHEIFIESPTFFNQYQNNHLKTVVIGDELIRYGEVSPEAPWRLMHCQRGAFNTKPQPHLHGDTIGKLADHAYKVFLSDPRLSITIAKNIAALFNRAGLRQVSFDGLEGNRSTGMGNYGEILFTNSWFEALDSEIKKHYIADASRTSHYFWHIYTRMNWGEPWYAGFRESQTEYRMKNQKYFKRNLMPGMLGWFKMTPETSMEDMEWMLARSAAFNAGYGFVTNKETLRNNAQSAALLQLINIWEEARLSGIFPEQIKREMENLENEYTLKRMNDGTWMLDRIYSGKFNYVKQVLQPGEPTHKVIEFKNSSADQTIHFILDMEQGTMEGVDLEIDNFKNIILPVHMEKGYKLKYSGGDRASLFDSNWRALGDVMINPEDFYVTGGAHTINIDMPTLAGEVARVKIEIRLVTGSMKLNKSPE